MTEGSSLDLCRVLFFGHPADQTQVHRLRGGVWQTDLLGPSSHPGPGSETRYVAIEVDDSSHLREHLEVRLRDLAEGGISGCCIVLPDRPAAELVSQMLTARSLGPSTLFGIDPDYYHGIVPLTGDHHRRIETFVLGLKPATDFPAKVKHWIKRALISTGLSTRLYERFVIVLEGPSCS